GIAADGRREPEPEREAALPRRPTVLLDDAAEPRAPERRVVGLREDERVLHRDPRLVVVAVPDPRAERVRREPARVHADVEGMAVVVAAASLAAEPLDERRAHTPISISSSATSHPAAATAARSGEPSRTSGFVLFRCTVRVRGRLPARGDRVHGESAVGARDRGSRHEAPPPRLPGAALEDAVERVVGREGPADAVGREDEERLALPQREEPERVIELGARERDRGDRRVADAAGMERRAARELRAHVGRRVQEEPADAVGADGRRRLPPGPHPPVAPPGGAAVRAPAVPLRQAAARRRAEHADDHRATPEDRPRPGSRRAPRSSRSRRRSARPSASAPPRAIITPRGRGFAPADTAAPLTPGGIARRTAARASLLPSSSPRRGDHARVALRDRGIIDPLAAGWP